MEPMASMWEVPIKNERTGEETSVIVPANNRSQALNKAMEVIQKKITDPFAKISYGEPKYQFDVPWSSLNE